jgi:hypothetical protein
MLIKQTVNVIGTEGEKQRNAIERGKFEREIRESGGENHGVAEAASTRGEDRKSNATSARLGEKPAERKQVVCGFFISWLTF